LSRKRLTRRWSLILAVVLVVGTGGEVLAVHYLRSCQTAFAGIVDSGPNRATDVGLYDRHFHHCRTLTHDGQSYAAAISPDGKQVAYVSGRGYTSDEEVGNSHQSVYVMDIDGSHDRRLTTTNDYDPEWSPDGRQIAFEQNPVATDDFHVVVVDARTGRVIRSTHTAENTSAYAWLDPGTLAFETGLKVHNYRAAIEALTLTTGTIHTLLSLSTVDPVAINGKRHLVAYTTAAGSGDLVVQDLKGGQPHLLARGSTTADVAPAFWTNDNELVFSRLTDLLTSANGTGRPVLLKAHAADLNYSDDPHNSP
jgi:dipeptidyl aminopeptidase/acylaminoacyl peptidase